MVVDSITDSQLSHGSPRDFAKKQKANRFRKLKQLKIDDARRLRSLRDKPPDTKTISDRFSDLQAWSIDHDDSDEDETALSAGSPTSVLKNKDSDSNKSEDDCFCCAKQITEEEEEAFDDAYENWEDFSDALNSFDNERPLHHEDDHPNPNTNQRKQETSPEKAIRHKVSRKKKKKKSDEKREGDECPICSEEMDDTDVRFSPCPCGFKLCLFCHKQINENDGRCPACRKNYEQTSCNSGGEVCFQQRGRGTVRLSPSFKGLDIA